MGNFCCSKETRVQPTLSIVTELIDKDLSEQLEHRLHKIGVDCSSTVKIDNLTLTLSGYALYIGSVGSFEVLFERSNFDHRALSKPFAKVSKSPLDIICEMGYLSILKFYLPLYLRQERENGVGEESEDVSLFSRKSLPAVPVTPLTALQKATEKGFIEIIRYIISYFKGKQPPNELDLHFIGDVTGLNCALTACRTGNFELIQFLYEECGADFHVFNKRGESALQITAAWSKKRKKLSYLKSFKYLVEVVGIDLTYEYEDILLVLENFEIIHYVEKKLADLDIFVKKSEVDHKYTLYRNRSHTQKNNNEDDMNGSKFEFRELFKEELADSSLSPISRQESKEISNNSIMNI